MPLTLQNFETGISASILQRGRQYYHSGAVTDLAETGDNTWTASVEGTETYSVEIALKGNKIAESFCDCPYDGEICKHVVAMLFALREEDSLQATQRKKAKRDVFENILQAVSAKDCQDFIRIYAAKNKSFKTEFELFFAHKDHRVDVAGKYEGLVQQLIKKHSDRGYIDYRSSSGLARELHKLLANGRTYLAQQNFRDALALAKAVIKPVTGALEDADDSSGSLGDIIEEGISLLENIAESNEAGIDIKEQMLSYLQTELKNELYFEWGDYGYLLVEVFRSLAVQLQRAEAFMAFVEAGLKKSTGEYKSHRRAYFLQSKIDFLQATGKADEALKLTLQNLEIPALRQAEVEKALAKKDYGKAKALIAEGISIAEKKDHPGTVSGWKEELLRIAVSEKDKEAIRKYTRHFAFDHGFSEAYYRQWKQTYTGEEWKAVIEQHINATIEAITREWKKNKSHWHPAHPPLLQSLAPVYLQEGYLDRLLALVQQERQLSIMLQYHDYLYKLYGQELLSLYLPALEKYGNEASDRKGYANLASMIKKIMKNIPAGRDRLLALTQKLIAQFSVKPRRPAMIEELRTIK